jgi:hypothetical protein
MRKFEVESSQISRLYSRASKGHENTKCCLQIRKIFATVRPPFPPFLRLCSVSSVASVPVTSVTSVLVTSVTSVTVTSVTSGFRVLRHLRYRKHICLAA